nr:Os05g0574200 [Ipomoea batatas]
MIGNNSPPSGHPNGGIFVTMSLTSVIRKPLRFGWLAKAFLNFSSPTLGPAKKKAVTGMSGLNGLTARGSEFWPKIKGALTKRKVKLVTHSKGRIVPLQTIRMSLRPKATFPSSVATATYPFQFDSFSTAFRCSGGGLTLYPVAPTGYPDTA